MNEKFVPFLRENFQKAVGEEGDLPMSEEADPVGILTTMLKLQGGTLMDYLQIKCLLKTVLLL